LRIAPQNAKPGNLPNQLIPLFYGVITPTTLAGCQSVQENPLGSDEALNPKHRGLAALAQSEGGVPVRAETLEEVLKNAKGALADLTKMNIHGSEYGC